MILPSDTLVIDAGNTSVKMAQFREGELIALDRFASDLFFQFIQSDKLADIPIVVSSVLGDSFLTTLKGLRPKAFVAHSKLKLPLIIEYETPDTLGMDRLCNAIYGAITTSDVAIIIDVGTCIKFDVVVNGRYQGGSISPGIDLRYKALNDYTALLPKVEYKGQTQLIGSNTITSIQSGVLNGIRNELLGGLEGYLNRYPESKIFLTGGDCQYFDFGGKNNIFVDENLTLKGLYKIYEYNKMD